MMKAKMFDHVFLKSGISGFIVDICARKGEDESYIVEPRPYDPQVGLTIFVSPDEIQKIEKVTSLVGCVD